MKHSAKKKNLFFLFCFLLLQLILMTVQVRSKTEYSSCIRSGFFRLASPLATVSSVFVSPFKDFYTGYVDLRGVYKKSVALRRENDRMKLERAVINELKRENSRLRELLDLRRRLRIRTIASEVIGINLERASRTVVVDAGRDKGVALNDPVVAVEGVVGRVIGVSGGTAKVQLISDPGSGIAIRSKRTGSAVQGILVGGKSEALLKLKFVSNFDDISSGDELITSGLDRIYPPGFKVGRVESVEDGPEFHKIITVRPEVRFHSFEAVLILKTGRNDEETSSSFDSFEENLSR